MLLTVCIILQYHSIAVELYYYYTEHSLYVQQQYCILLYYMLLASSTLFLNRLPLLYLLYVVRTEIADGLHAIY
jgi:hypothetical protein